MTTISLRIPPSLHGTAKALAQREGISINQLITLALAEKLFALGTEDYLEERAKRGSRKNSWPQWQKCQMSSHRTNGIGFHYKGIFIES